MKKLVFLFIFFSTLAFAENECVVCHKGIEDIRDRESTMMKEILKVADKAGHKGNDCIVCHGGNPYNKSKEYGHKGTVKYFRENEGPKTFYPSPTDSSINKNTCGMCHKNQVKQQYSSMMMNIKVDVNESNISQNPHEIIGTKKYIEYMDRLSKKEPKAFTKKQLREDSHKKSRNCSSCHIPYAKDGLYKGSDVRVSKKSPGHIKTHQIQSSRKVQVTLDDNNYTGTSLDSCAKCHSAKKFTALSFEGKMDIKSKHHLDMQENIHFKKGMLCQDCHTSNDLHGSGYQTNENLAAVEIECQDCHGTTKKYPWELPLGFSDEYNTTRVDSRGRGVVKDVAKYLKQGFVAESKDGYILSARGNPLPNVVKDEKYVLVHLANGKDIELKPLKLLKKDRDLSTEALAAMDNIDSHTSKLECYACHTKWAPQYYMDENKNRFVRWEDPALAQNGEGRISPLIQKEDISLSAHPHTISKKSRSCESCHTLAKTMGHGIGSLKTSHTKLTDIKSNFKLASVLDKEHLDKLDRRGMCLSCHKTIPDGNLAVSAMVHVAKMSEIHIDKSMHSYILSKLLDIGAWAQLITTVLTLLIIAYFIYAKFIKKKPVNPRNEGWK